MGRRQESRKVKSSLTRPAPNKLKHNSKKVTVVPIPSLTLERLSKNEIRKAARGVWKESKVRISRKKVSDKSKLEKNSSGRTLRRVSSRIKYSDEIEEVDIASDDESTVKYTPAPSRSQKKKPVSKKRHASPEQESAVEYKQVTYKKKKPIAPKPKSPTPSTSTLPSPSKEIDDAERAVRLSVLSTKKKLYDFKIKYLEMKMQLLTRQAKKGE